MSEKIHLNKKYQQLTKQSKIAEGDVLYRLPQPEDGDIEPLICTVTKWGERCNSEQYHHLIEVLQEYPESFINQYTKEETEGLGAIKRRLKLRELKKTLAPRNTFLPVECLYKQV